jgi:hypothetical protein
MLSSKKAHVLNNRSQATPVHPSQWYHVEFIRATLTPAGTMQRNSQTVGKETKCAFCFDMSMLRFELLKQSRNHYNRKRR